MKPQADPQAATVLVVDDDSALRSMLVMMLGMDGWTHVLDTWDCKEALHLATEWREQLRLVVVDMLMPNYSGDECGRAVHEQCPAVKFLLISGDAEHLEAPLEELGWCAAGLAKPFTFRELSHQIRQL